MKLKTVVVGFGRAADTLAEDARMARYFPKASHAAVLADHPAFDWSAVVDPAETARRRAAERWAVAHVVSSLDDLPKPERFDCAVIATPPEHRDGILERLPGLKSVMLEKPVARDRCAAEAFAQTCRDRDIRVQVNYWRRGVPGFQALAGGELAARIGSVRAAFGVYGGGLRNTGSHIVDFVRFLLGEIAHADPASDIRPAPDSPLRDDRTATVDMVLRGGAPVRLAAIDFRDYREASLDIWGTDGRLAIEQESLVTRLFRRTANRGLEAEREIASDAPETLAVPVGAAFSRLYDNLAAAVRSDAPLVSPLSSALVTERLLDTVLANTGRQDDRSQVA